LTTGEDVVEGNPCHARQLGVVDQTHEAVEETLGKIGVLRSALRAAFTPHLQTVHCKSAARVCCTVLKFGNDGVVNVLLLLAQEVGADGVEGVAAELVVSLNDLQDVHLEASIDVDCLRVALPERLG
jgi:hypothetical protein